MSATESREVLEAVIWRALTACHVRGTPVCGCNANVAAILSLADAYATAVAEARTASEVNRVVSDPELLAARQRLAIAAAEIAGRTA